MNDELKQWADCDAFHVVHILNLSRKFEILTENSYFMVNKQKTKTYLDGVFHCLDCAIVQHFAEFIGKHLHEIRQWQNFVFNI